MILQPLSPDNLDALVAAAVEDADPLEVMPPVAGPPGWTDARRAALTDFLRRRHADSITSTYVVMADGRAIGFARLDLSAERPTDVEVGYWLVRSKRGLGLGGELIGHLVELARHRGAARLVAGTSRDNVASQRILAAAGAKLTHHEDGVTAVVDLGVDLGQAAE